MRFHPIAGGAAAVLLLLSGGGLRAQRGPDGARVDPALRFTVRLLRARPADGAVGAPAPGPSAVPRDSLRLRAAAPVWPYTPAAAYDLAPGGPRLRTLIRVDGVARSLIRRLGGEVGIRAGDVITARIPVHALDSLAAADAVRFVAGVKRLAPAVILPGRRRAPLPPGGSAAPRIPAILNDRGTAEIGADGLRRRVGDTFHGLAGQGVIIGIYDSGLDLDHPDFLDGGGRTRVLYAWDQSAESGDPPGRVGDAVFGYGDECDAAEIDAGECALVDRLGHGTHIAGIAAGDGSATGNGRPAYRYTGVAPAADLIVVKGGDGVYTTDRVIEGVSYIFERAAELGRPAVVNLSLGTQEGPHDGTLLFERALSALTGPGRIIVASAGNQGTNRNESPSFIRDPVHAMGSRSGEHRLIIPEYTPHPGAANDLAVLELWYDGSDSLTITIVTPKGVEVPAQTGDTAAAVTPAGAVYMINASAGQNPRNGDHQALIALLDSAGSAPPASGAWKIRVEPEAVYAGAVYHLWLVGHTFTSCGSFSCEFARLEGGTTNSHLVTAPATADSIIAVAAYTSKFRWESRSGPVTYPVRESLGDIASFSSPGPRRDGVLKPIVAAPGKLIMSSRAESASLWTELDLLIDADGVHAALMGSSMAAPFATGAIALLLQVDPRLSPGEIRDLLARSARGDGYTPHPYTGGPNGTPNAQWGWGKLDVGEAVRLLRPGGLVLAGERVNLSQNPVRQNPLIINYEVQPRRIGIYDFAGRLVRVLTGDALGDWFAVWDLENDAGRRVANGAYLLLVQFGDERVMRKVFVLRP